MSFLLGAALRVLSDTRLAGRLLGRDMDALTEVSDVVRPTRRRLAQEEVHDPADPPDAGEQSPFDASEDMAGSDLGGGEDDGGGFIGNLLERLLDHL